MTTMLNRMLDERNRLLEGHIKGLEDNVKNIFTAASIKAGLNLLTQENPSTN